VRAANLVRDLVARFAQWRRERLRRGGAVPKGLLGSAQSRLMVFLLVTLACLGGVYAWGLAYLSPVSEGQHISFTDVVQLAERGDVKTATLYDVDKRVVGTFVLPTTAQSQSAKPQPVTFWAQYPNSDAETPLLFDKLIQGGVNADIIHQTDKTIVQALTLYLLPLVILANLFALVFLLTRGGGEGLGGLVEFSRIGKKPADGKSDGRITFADVAGADEAVAELREVRDYLADPARFAVLGAQPPKGVLLFGPPGCGKTLLAKAIAGEADVPFFSISGAEFVESLVGVGAARVRDLFRQVRRVSPAIVFIDEIDAAGRRRGGIAGGQEERESTLNQLLVEMDGFEAATGIVVMGATNRPDILDPALLRPGRFDRQVTVEPPDLIGRQAILELYGSRRPVEDDVDYALLARRTPGFTGADLANVINEAALLAVRSGRLSISMEELEEAVQRVLVGPQRRGHLLSGDERRRVAVHEAGHALVAAALGRLGELQRVSIISRGRTLGQATASKAWQERTVLTRSELRAEMVTLLAGTAAEVLLLDEPSTGAEDDLDRATGLAEMMAGRYGMSERLGRVRRVRIEGNEFLGGSAVPSELASGPALGDLDREVRHLLDEAEAAATELLHTHRSLLMQVAERLEERETLETAELERLLEPVRPEMNLVTGTALPVEPNGHVAQATVETAGE
jgi:cell division protease FtsH